MSDTSNLGKKAEAKIKLWLDRPEEGFCFLRLPDQMTGFYGSTNICDFLLYRKPYLYCLESKATWNDRFDFSMITQYQHDEMLKKSEIEGVICYVAVLFATYKQAFLIDIRDIAKLEKEGKKSLNIKKKASWPLPYISIRTLLSKKQLLDYDPAQANEIFGGSSK